MIPKKTLGEYAADIRVWAIIYFNVVIISRCTGWHFVIIAQAFKLS